MTIDKGKTVFPTLAIFFAVTLLFVTVLDDTYAETNEEKIEKIGQQGVQLEKEIKSEKNPQRSEELQDEMDDLKRQMQALGVPTVEEYESNKAFWRNMAVQSHIAEETKSFDVNGFTVTTNSSNVVDIKLSWGNGVMTTGTIVFDKVIKDNIHIQIPKEMPRTTNMDFGVGFYAIQSPRYAELLITETESDCFYNLAIPVRYSDEIRITSWTMAAGRTVTQAVIDCEEIEIIKLSLKTQIKYNLHIKEIECRNDKHVLVERPNNDLACVSPINAEKLDWKII